MIPNKLMILDEDDEYKDYRYKIACSCTDNDCDLNFDINANKTKNPHSGKFEVTDWSIEFYTYKYHYGNWWNRIKSGIKLIFGFNPGILHAFILDKDNVEAIQYVLKKYKEVGDRIS